MSNGGQLAVPVTAKVAGSSCLWTQHGAPGYWLAQAYTQVTINQSFMVRTN